MCISNHFVIPKPFVILARDLLLMKYGKCVLPKCHSKYLNNMTNNFDDTFNEYSKPQKPIKS